jgi:hypothetical protein
MNISEQLVLLAELANVDAKGKSISEKLDSVPAAAKKADDAVAALKKQIDDTEAKVQEADKLRRATENELFEERNKIKKWENRAQELRGEREHAALLSEIGTARRVIHRLEDTQLEQMEALEATQKAIVELKKKLDAATTAAAAEWDKVGGDVKALKGDREALQAARTALLAKLPPPLVKRYDQIAAKRAGVGVSFIKGEVCSACKRMLPPQMCIQIRKGAIVEQCPSCNRLLVHEAMTQAAQQS